MFLRALVSRHKERKSSSNKMAAGLSGAQTKQNGLHKSQHRTELKHTHINLALFIRHSLKYKNSLSENLLERHKTSDVFKDFKRRKGSQVERKRRRRRERGQKTWPYRRLLPPADTQALQDFPLGFQKREDWNSALPETRPENSSSLPRGGDQSPILSSS